MPAIPFIKKSLQIQICKIFTDKAGDIPRFGFQGLEEQNIFKNQTILPLVLIDPEAWLKTDDLEKPLTLDQNSFYRWQDLDPPIPAEIVRLV